ncbi:uncharacterized protein LOC115659237 isoform X2 [Gopherus evgoodei]|uniref:uncharacterized protein LOC115659237 isoform X2 n=1 Tax=Gopherus evgoodei TaxID=1825980 RepID=UPI0011CF7944|nr:uncharacterized protein LOC115659237 isoform X2 [Gopherus evgoodei]
MPVESEWSQEEEILDEEGDPEEEDDSEVRDACSQEFFSAPEEASQSQLSDVGEVQAGEEAPAEWLCRIRRQPRRAKEDFLRDVMVHSATKKQELKERQDSEKRDGKEITARRNEGTEWLLKVMEHQADTLQAILALQTKQLRTRPPPQPLSQNSFPCSPQTPPTHSYQLPDSSLYPAFHFSPLTIQHC